MAYNKCYTNADESENQGLKMNKSKAKVMMNNDDVNNTQVENVESYIYLGQRYNTREKKTRQGD